MMKHFQDLPRTLPLTILSDEKWYPYSQYEFHRDGTPNADSVERSTAPIVPEVMNIDLPTGFEASHLNSPPKHSTLPPPDSSGFRSAPTVVDFPATPPGNKSVWIENGSSSREDMDLSKLSEKGKRFIEHLPDLSHMLKSTLCLPDSDEKN